MASIIDISGIDQLYPRAGQNNDSQGFRNNFVAIASGLTTAKSEITELQANTFRTDAENDFGGSLIVDSNMKIVTKVAYSGSIDDSTFNISFNNGHYQSFVVAQTLPECTISLTDWPVTGRHASMRIELRSNSNVNILFENSAGTLKLDYNWPKKILLRPEPVVLEFYTTDGGATVWGRYLYRSYDSTNHPFTNQEGSELVIFNVSIADDGSGIQETFFLNDQLLNETPELYFTPGTRYRFILEDASNKIAPLRFSTTPDTAVPASITPYTQNVTIDGNAGEPNAYIEIEITPDTELPLYLYAEEQPNGLDTSKIGQELSITSNPSYIRIKTSNKLQDADEDTYIIAETDWEVDNDDLDFYIAGVHRMQLNDKCLRILDGTKLCVEDTRDDALDVKGGARISGDLVVGGDIIYSPDLSLSVIDTWKNLNEVLTNTLVIDTPVNISNYRIGKALRLLGVSTTQEVEEATGLGITTVERIGLTEPGVDAALNTTVSYKIAEFDLLNGGISAATEQSDIEVVLTDLGTTSNIFNLNKNLKVTFSRTDVNKGVIVYRKIVGIESDFSLLSVLGPKDLKVATQDLIFVDYYNYDLNTWSNKTDKNSFTSNSGIVHIPIAPPAAPLYGWDDAIITSINGDRVVLNKTFYHNESITSIIDDTQNLQNLIDSRADSGLNYLDLDNRTHYVSRLTVPTGFSIYGKGNEAKLVKQYWSTNFNTNDNHLIVPNVAIGAESTFKDVSIENVKLDGNFLNQYLLQDDTTTSSNRNYLVYLYGKRITIRDVQVSNVVGGGLFLYNVVNPQIVTEFITLKDSVIENGAASYRYDTFSPVVAREMRNSKVLSSTLKNFPASVDFVASDKSLIATNIIENCGAGLLTYGSVSTIFNPNILLGPAGEFLPVADMLNTEYDSINIMIDKDTDYNSYKGLYQENGNVFDLTANGLVLEGKVNQLIKTSTNESLGTGYSGIMQLDLPGSGNSVGEFSFRIVEAQVNQLLAIDSNLRDMNHVDYNKDYAGMVYRIIATEYVPTNNITKAESTNVGEGLVEVTVTDATKFKLNDVIRINSLNLSAPSDPSLTTTEATITAINNITKIITVQFAALNGSVSGGTSGTLDLKNKFVLAKGKIN
jgi:hypothetical protein